MERADETNFFDACNNLKKMHRCKITNIFMNSQELRRKFKNQACSFHKGNKSIFLLLPTHKDMQAMYFISADPEAFASDLPRFMLHATQFSSVKTSLIGKEDTCQRILSSLEDNKFATIKKLLRMRLEAPDNKIISAMRMLAANYRDNASFANNEDAEEILSIICEEFDIVGDNIPDINEIRENIRKRNVTIIKIDNKIAALHYFQVENGIAHGYFDITRKEFRGGNGLIFALNLFEHDYFKSCNIKINRIYGWRDASKTRLIKSSSKTNSFPDGVVIYNMLWKPNSYSKNME